MGSQEINEVRGRNGEVIEEAVSEQLSQSQTHTVQKPSVFIMAVALGPGGAMTGCVVQSRARRHGWMCSSEQGQAPWLDV